MSKQRLTIRVSGHTLGKLRVLAVRRDISISDLVAEQIERLVGEEYEHAQEQAMTLLDRGFHMGGGVIRARRNELYER